MAIDVFPFSTEVQDTPQATFTYDQTSVSYGDGYTQVSSAGINSEKKSWPLTFSGNKTKIMQIINFMRNHVATPFLWTDPLGEQTTYVADATIQPQAIGGGMFVLTVTFNQYYMGGVQ